MLDESERVRGGITVRVRPGHGLRAPDERVSLPDYDSIRTIRRHGKVDGVVMRVIRSAGPGRSVLFVPVRSARGDLNAERAQDMKNPGPPTRQTLGGEDERASLAVAQENADQILPGADAAGSGLEAAHTLGVSCALVEPWRGADVRRAGTRRRVPSLAERHHGSGKHVSRPSPCRAGLLVDVARVATDVCHRHDVRR